MKLKNVLLFRPHLHVLMHTGVGSPYALQIGVRKVGSMIAFLGFLFFAFFIGTVLFFREMEISYKLEQQLLALEIEKKLTEEFSNLSAVTAKPTKVAAKKPATKPKVVPSVPKAPKATVAPAMAKARVSALGLQCTEKNCGVSISMVPSGAGSVEGKLFLVLETEVKRIGAATHTSEARSKFIVYPGFENLDQLNRKTLSLKEGKPFKFSKALQSSTKFEVSSSLKPIAVDAYVYDINNKLVSHRRRVLEKSTP